MRRTFALSPRSRLATVGCSLLLLLMTVAVTTADTPTSPATQQETAKGLTAVTGVKWDYSR